MTEQQRGRVPQALKIIIALFPFVITIAVMRQVAQVKETGLVDPFVLFYGLGVLALFGFVSFMGYRAVVEYQHAKERGWI